jgi:hypothetical protein
LEALCGKGKLTKRWIQIQESFFRMARFPRWSGAKHFKAVSTAEFVDGQAFYDILKVSGQFNLKSGQTDE